MVFCYGFKILLWFFIAVKNQPSLEVVDFTRSMFDDYGFNFFVFLLR